MDTRPKAPVCPTCPARHTYRDARPARSQRRPRRLAVGRKARAPRGPAPQARQAASSPRPATSAGTPSRTSMSLASSAAQARMFTIRRTEIRLGPAAEDSDPQCRQCRHKRVAMRTRSATARDRLCGGQAMTVVTGGASVTGTTACSSRNAPWTDSGTNAYARPNATSWNNCV